MPGSKLYDIGLEDRDRLKENLGGGIPKGSIVVIEGEYSAGKSAISQRFTYGFCREGYTTTLLSSELTVQGFIDQMHSLGYDIEEYLLNEQLLFLHAYVDQQSEDQDLLSRLMNADTMWQSDIVIIDTFDAILRNDGTFDSLVRQNEERQGALEIISFFRDIIGEGKTIILTIDPTTLNEEVMSPFRAIADVHLELEMTEIGNETSRSIVVNRFSGMGEQVGDMIGYGVRPDIGIVIESRSVA
ncbi:ATPase domain-containing protein [Halorutilales archaeon Cl-col2-1]